MQEFLSLLETVLQSFEVSGSPQAFLVLFGLLFARFVAFVNIVPFFGGQAVPGTVKVATATALVIVAFPAAATEIPLSGETLGFGPVGFVALLAKEVFVGFTLGFVASAVFHAVVVAGRVIDHQRGATMGELMAPQVGQRVSQMGQFKVQLAIVIFLTIGAHRFFISALMRSFEALPATRFPNIEPGFGPAAEFITVLTGTIFSLGVQLAIPAVLALLLTDLFFGLINRVAPQANVFFLSLPVKMAMGIFVVAISISFIVNRFIASFDSAFEAFEFMLELFSRSF
ncbi:MAG: flagellar biosynthetic protein FliR [Pyrinomonadaceae bacterium]|nr:flagellar biosynthetic protein FliR [Pyrinomonadaceae bacterium]